MIIYMTRHGHSAQLTQAQTGEPQFSPADSPLSTLGREQAEQLGKRLRRMGFNGTIHAPPYRWTSETAQLIAQALDAELHPEPAIRERVKVADSLASFDGLDLERLRQAFPCLAADPVLLYPWWTLKVETDDMVLTRVRPLLEYLIEEMDRDVLLVGHGTSMWSSIRYFLEPYPDLLANNAPDWNCALTAIRIKPRVKPILLWDIVHLAYYQATF